MEHRGHAQLRSASNIKVCGRVSEVQYLDELSRPIDHYTFTDVSRSSGKTGRSTSRQESKDEILSVADLTALPRFRAVLLASGAPATRSKPSPG